MNANTDVPVASFDPFAQLQSMSQQNVPSFPSGTPSNAHQQPAGSVAAPPLPALPVSGGMPLNSFGANFGQPSNNFQLPTPGTDIDFSAEDFDAWMRELQQPLGMPMTQNSQTPLSPATAPLASSPTFQVDAQPSTTSQQQQAQCSATPQTGTTGFSSLAPEFNFDVSWDPTSFTQLQPQQSAPQMEQTPKPFTMPTPSPIPTPSYSPAVVATSPGVGASVLAQPSTTAAQQQTQVSPLPTNGHMETSFVLNNYQHQPGPPTGAVPSTTPVPNFWGQMPAQTRPVCYQSPAAHANPMAPRAANAASPQTVRHQLSQGQNRQYYSSVVQQSPSNSGGTPLPAFAAGAGHGSSNAPSPGIPVHLPGHLEVPSSSSSSSPLKGTTSSSVPSPASSSGSAIAWKHSPAHEHLFDPVFATAGSNAPSPAGTSGSSSSAPMWNPTSSQGYMPAPTIAAPANANAWYPMAPTQVSPVGAGAQPLPPPTAGGNGMFYAKARDGQVYPVQAGHAYNPTPSTTAPVPGPSSQQQGPTAKRKRAEHTPTPPPSRAQIAEAQPRLVRVLQKQKKGSTKPQVVSISKHLTDPVPATSGFVETDIQARERKRRRGADQAYEERVALRKTKGSKAKADVSGPLTGKQQAVDVSRPPEYNAVVPPLVPVAYQYPSVGASASSSSQQGESYQQSGQPYTWDQSSALPAPAPMPGTVAPMKKPKKNVTFSVPPPEDVIDLTQSTSPDPEPQGGKRKRATKPAAKTKQKGKGKADAEPEAKRQKVLETKQKPIGAARMLQLSEEERAELPKRCEDEMTVYFCSVPSCKFHTQYDVLAALHKRNAPSSCREYLIAFQKLLEKNKVSVKGQDKQITHANSSAQSASSSANLQISGGIHHSTGSRATARTDRSAGEAPERTQWQRQFVPPNQPTLSFLAGSPSPSKVGPKNETSNLMAGTVSPQKTTAFSKFSSSTSSSVQRPPISYNTTIESFFKIAPFHGFNFQLNPAQVIEKRLPVVDAQAQEVIPFDELRQLVASRKIRNASDGRFASLNADVIKSGVESLDERERLSWWSIWLTERLLKEKSVPPRLSSSVDDLSVDSVLVPDVIAN